MDVVLTAGCGHNMTLTPAVFTMAVQFTIHIKMQINRINRPIKACRLPHKLTVTKEDLCLKRGKTGTDEFWQEDQ